MVTISGKLVKKVAKSNRLEKKSHKLMRRRAKLAKKNHKPV